MRGQRQVSTAWSNIYRLVVKRGSYQSAAIQASLVAAGRRGGEECCVKEFLKFPVLCCFVTPDLVSSSSLVVCWW